MFFTIKALTAGMQFANIQAYIGNLPVLVLAWTSDILLVYTVIFELVKNRMIQIWSWHCTFNYWLNEIFSKLSQIQVLLILSDIILFERRDRVDFPDIRSLRSRSISKNNNGYLELRFSRRTRDLLPNTRIQKLKSPNWVCL